MTNVATTTSLILTTTVEERRGDGEMEGYKQAKEAFVSDNLGQSIWSINLTSLTALVGNSS